MSDSDTPSTATTWAASRRIGKPLRQRVGNPTLKVLLFAIASHADAKNQCRKTRAQLGADAELSVRTVSRGIIGLIELGLIETAPTNRWRSGNGCLCITLLIGAE